MTLRRIQIRLAFILVLAWSQAGCAHLLFPPPEKVGTQCSHNMMPPTVLAFGIALGAVLAADALADKAGDCSGGLSCLEGMDDAIGAVLVGAGGVSMALGVLSTGVQNASACKTYLKQVEEQTKLKSEPTEQ